MCVGPSKNLHFQHGRAGHVLGRGTEPEEGEFAWATVGKGGQGGLATPRRLTRGCLWSWSKTLVMSPPWRTACPSCRTHQAKEDRQQFTGWRGWRMTGRRNNVWQWFKQGSINLEGDHGLGGRGAVKRKGYEEAKTYTIEIEKPTIIKAKMLEKIVMLQKFHFRKKLRMLMFKVAMGVCHWNVIKSLWQKTRISESMRQIITTGTEVERP